MNIAAQREPELTDEGAEELLRFWFGTDEEITGPAVMARVPLWFGKRAADDDALRAGFAERWRLAGTGALDGWAATPRGRLALVILHDQLSRVFARGTGDAFARDGVALQLAVEGIERGDDAQLRPVERVFLYLPLMHAEDPAVQTRSVALYRALAASAPAPVAKFLTEVQRFALRHQEIVARFGRFPHRNAALGRDTTDEERAFLREADSSF